MRFILASTATILVLSCVEYSAPAQEGVSLEPVLELQSANGGRRLINQSARRTQGKQGLNISTAFVAVVATTWPAGLVPIFAVESSEGFQLRRLPPRGQENHTEPLFFALPLEDETNAIRLAGRWNGLASNAQRSNHSPDWELAIEGERVAGRFDPHGEYRVAFITGGLFRSNRLELNVEYINDRYVLQGTWQDGKLAGTWRQLDEAETGVWEASRPTSPPKTPSAAGTVPLFEWRRGNERRYAVTNFHEPGWDRAARPIARVWR